MARGNQREKAREKNLKKQPKQKKKDDGTTFKKRAETDAEIMRQKQQKALEAKATENKSEDKSSDSTQNK
ncbi:hypothetical protein RclHR1_08620017 [Rhizophagus clarus]|uniref:Small EDRK-rich factor 2 n=1 Tax=Rhizophagus clarus TaxID=94130 RepID=A0A2Z6S3V7_9GLOM|nr:hypothetical protein RclHR1_08620017 [Rhizophagus clarus]GES89757.1 small EDRK-rich factor 2 [Rhizophagus clarus]